MQQILMWWGIDRCWRTCNAHANSFVKQQSLIRYLYCIIYVVTQVITFDEGGVSAHPNHIATYRGTELALKTMCRNVKKIIGFKLHTTSCLRQFLGVFDIPLSFFCFEYSIINFNLALVLKGMAAHKSQNVWYRVLFVLFCRYTYVNTFICIN